MKIGVFDSGLGGLQILRGIQDVLTEYDYTYLGDNARVPYGGRSPEIIYQYSIEAIDFLFKKGCKLVIVACNTVSAAALRRIQQEWLRKNYPDRNVLGVLVPAIEAAAESGAKRVGLIGTHATVDSDYFETELKKRYPDKEIEVFKNACPLLVPIIEEGETEWEGLDLILQKYLKPIKAQNVDTLLLGCTHYGIIKKRIQNVVGSKVDVIAEEEIIGSKLKDYLSRHPELETHLNGNSELEIFLTDYSQRYKKMAEGFLEREGIEIKKVSLPAV